MVEARAVRGPAAPVIGGPQDLAGAFGRPTTRADNIPGPLRSPGAAAPPAPDPAPAPPPAAAPAPRPAPAAPAPAAPPALESAPGPAVDGDPTDGDAITTTKAAPVQVSVSVRDRLHRYIAAHPGESFTTVILDAVETLVADTGKVAAAFATPARTGPLFRGHRGSRRHHTETQVSITMRPAVPDLELLNELWKTVGAPNRAALISTALELFLPR